MANFQNNAITERGILLRSHVDMGAVFTATKIVMGSGYIPAGKTAKTITDVVTPVKELTINKKERSNDGKVIFGGAYTNEGIDTEFYFRELALYAKAVYPDGTEVDEVLYCYGNAEDSAELMAAYSTSTAVERQMDIVTFVGNEAEIDLTIASGLYIPREEKGAPGGVAALDDSGNVLIREFGSVGANSNMTVLAHRTEPGGLARYISVSKENDLRRSVFLTEELEGGGSVSYGLLHTGMEDIPEIIGAAKNHEFVAGVNLLTWAAAQPVGGPFFANTDVTGVPTPGFWHGLLTMGAANGDKGIFIFNGSAAYSIATLGASFVNSKWQKFAIGEFLSIAGGKLTGDLTIQKANNGSAHFFKNHTETADYGTEVRDINRGGAVAGISMNAEQQKLHAKFINEGQTFLHEILHTGNMAQYMGVTQASLEE